LGNLVQISLHQGIKKINNTKYYRTSHVD